MKEIREDAQLYSKRRQQEMRDYGEVLKELTRTHEEWLAFMRYGMPTILGIPGFLFELLAEEAEKVAAHSGGDKSAADALRDILAELELQIVPSS